MADVNFNYCHTLFKAHYVNLSIPDNSNKVAYISTGAVSATINVIISVIGAKLIWSDLKIERMTANNFTSKLKMMKTTGRVMIPVLIQITDSMFDSIYFAKLKSENRIINVGSGVHVFQGL